MRKEQQNRLFSHASPYVEHIAADLSLEIWPNGNAGILLFYPGSMLGPGHYYVLLNAFFTAGFTVASPHFIGHGLQLQGWGRFKLFTFDKLVDQCLAAEEWLFTRYGLPIAVCGHSQGGILAIAHAGRSGRIMGSFAMGALLPHMEKAIEVIRLRRWRRHRDQILNLLRIGAKIIPFLPVPLPVYLAPRRILAGRKSPAWTGRERGRICYPLAYLVSLFSGAIAPTLKTPCWIISAKNDALFTPDIIESTIKELHAPELNVIWLPEGGHLAPLNPFLANFMARTIAAACASKDFPLELSQEPK